jgi:hypothetical protein
MDYLDSFEYRFSSSEPPSSTIGFLLGPQGRQEANEASRSLEKFVFLGPSDSHKEDRKQIKFPEV